MSSPKPNGDNRPYEPGDLRIIRIGNSGPTTEKAYRIEEVQPPHLRLGPRSPISEKEALLMMRNLGSPYPGARYPDDPWLDHPGRRT